MTRNFYTLFLFIFCCSFTALAYSNNKIENSKEDDFDVNETIMHHIKDSHDFHILDWNGHPVSVPLPVILWTNEGLVAFMSSEFHHDDSGATVVKRKNQAFVKFHEEIYYAGNDKEGKYIQLDSSNHPINDKPLDLSITKLVFSMFLSIIIIFIIFILSAKSYARSKKGEPSGLGKFTEPIIIYIRDEVALPLIGEEKHEKYLPFLLTIFFFIWINNLMGMIPFFPLAPIEFLGIFIKPLSLMIRLFANISAGHIIVLSLISLIFIFKSIWVAPASLLFSVFISLIEVLVVAIQAYIFTMLSALYIGSAMEEQEH